jgi:hypothetical protein
MDALSDVLKAVRFEAAVYLRGELTAPWSLPACHGLSKVRPRLERGDHVMFLHYFQEGGCRIPSIDGHPPIDVVAGDLVLFTQGHPMLGSTLDLESGDGGAGRTSIVRGYLACSRSLCGPLLDVEPFGERRVRLMCHDVEDPTFDATAAATHPCAKIRPIHRPPRVPVGRVPHCRWRITIDDESGAYAQHPNLARIAASKIARLELALPARDAEPGGWPDYGGPFDPEFQLEDLSHRALLAADQEFAVQAHLLARSFLLCVAQHFGEAFAREVGRQQWTGIAGLAAERLHRALAVGGDGPEAIAKVLQLHPSFHPRAYVDLRVGLEDGGVRLAFGDCPAFEEGDAYSWFAGLDEAPHPALDAIARAVNPRATTTPAAPRAGERLAFRIDVDPKAEPHPEPADVKLARVSRGASLVLERRRPLRA